MSAAAADALAAGEAEDKGEEEVLSPCCLRVSVCTWERTRNRKGRAGLDAVGGDWSAGPCGTQRGWWEAVLGVRTTLPEAIGVLERDAMCPGIPGWILWANQLLNSLLQFMSWAKLICSTTVLSTAQSWSIKPLFQLLFIIFPLHSCCLSQCRAGNLWPGKQSPLHLSVMEWSLGAWICDAAPWSASSAFLSLLCGYTYLYPVSSFTSFIWGAQGLLILHHL